MMPRVIWAIFRSSGRSGRQTTVYFMLRIPSRTWKLIGTIVTLFSVVALLLAACGAPTAPRAGSAVLDDWVMEGYNPARTRARSSALAMPISLQRELRIPEDRGVGSPLVITKDTMLVEAEYHLRAIDLTTGDERWSFPEAGRYISPAIAGDMVYIRVESDNQGKVFAIDLDTGEQRWEFRATPHQRRGYQLLGRPPDLAGGQRQHRVHRRRQGAVRAKRRDRRAALGVRRGRLMSSRRPASTTAGCLSRTPGTCTRSISKAARCYGRFPTICRCTFLRSSPAAQCLSPTARSCWRWMPRRAASAGKPASRASACCRARCRAIC